MKSRTTKQFWKLYHDLPKQIQSLANKAYILWFDDPNHPSIKFKQVDPIGPIYSARINRQYRALGIRKSDTVIWFWIGKHAIYDRQLR